MPLLALILAYLLGGVPFGFLLVKWKTGRDVRQMGSGNIGATNVLRTTSRALGVFTLLLDIAKGFFAVWLAGRLSDGSPGWMAAAAVAAVAGHAFSVFLRFKGGKAFAACLGAFLYLVPAATAGIVLVFVIVVARTRYISLGSIAAAAMLPLAAWLIVHPPAPILLATVAAAILIVWRHRDNIARLRAGKESVVSLGGRRS